MCDCERRTMGSGCICPATQPVDWSKPVMFEDQPDTLVRVICTNRKDLGGRSIVLLESRPGATEVAKTCRPDGWPYGIVNRPEYKYKNVYEKGERIPQAHSTIEEAMYVGQSAICVVQFMPGNNKSAKIVHTY